MGGTPTLTEVGKVSDLQIRTEHITKDYPGTRALDDISSPLTVDACMPWLARMDRENPPW